MATPKSVIDTIVQVYDNTDPDDLDAIPRRKRILSFLQHIYNYTWNFRQWGFTYKESTISVVSGDNFAAFPSDYLEFGTQGGITDPSRNLRYTERLPYVLERVRKESPGVSASIDPIFAVFGGKIQFPFTATSAMSLIGFHRFQPETFAAHDSTTPMIMPDRYATIVLIPGVVFRAQESKNDAREGWAGQFRDGLSQMCALENPIKTSEGRRMPMAVRGAW